MNDFFYQIYRIVIPKFIRRKIRSKRLRAAILNYYSSPAAKLSDELKEVIAYLKENPISIFPYPFQHNYNENEIEVFHDKVKNLRYVLLDGRRLYFKRRWSEKRIRHSFNELQREQDPQSPHRYLNENFQVEEGDVLADIGVAEGNFALGAVDKAKAIYMFETDKEWIEALHATFEPWKEKVHIINKFVGGKISQNQTTIDEFFKDIPINFLKIDVDGGEADLLNGSQKLLSRQAPLKIAMCTYHKQNDESEFTRLLIDKGFSLATSDGYILFYPDKKIKAPYFRRGLIRAAK